MRSKDSDPSVQSDQNLRCQHEAFGPLAIDCVHSLHLQSSTSWRFHFHLSMYLILYLIQFFSTLAMKDSVKVDISHFYFDVKIDTV